MVGEGAWLAEAGAWRSRCWALPHLDRVGTEQWTLAVGKGLFYGPPAAESQASPTSTKLTGSWS
jgi:hypothetical protein